MKPAKTVTVLVAVLCVMLMVVLVLGAKRAHARTAMGPDWCLLNAMGWTLIEKMPNETVTGFNMRLIRAEIIEDCIAAVEKGYFAAEQIHCAETLDQCVNRLRDLKDKR
jgi:uncharacterized membrane protein YhaH (DUF805 family)